MTPEHVLASIGRQQAEVEAIIALWNSLICYPISEDRAKVWNLRYGFDNVISATKETAAKMLRKKMVEDHVYAFAGQIMAKKWRG